MAGMAMTALQAEGLDVEWEGNSTQGRSCEGLDEGIDSSMNAGGAMPPPY